MHRYMHTCMQMYGGVLSFFEIRYLPESGAHQLVRLCSVSSTGPPISSYHALLHLGARELNSCFHGKHFTDEPSSQIPNIPLFIDISRIKNSAP